MWKPTWSLHESPHQALSPSSLGVGIALVCPTGAAIISTADLGSPPPSLIHNHSSPPSWYWNRYLRVFWILSLIQLWHKLSFTLAIAFRINTSECWRHYCLVGFLLKNNAIPPPPLPRAPRQERIKSGEIISVIKFYSGPSMFCKKKRIRCQETLCFVFVVTVVVQREHW